MGIVVIVTAALVALGVVSFVQLSRQERAEIAARQAAARAHRGGAAAG